MNLLFVGNAGMEVNGVKAKYSLTNAKQRGINIFIINHSVEEWEQNIANGIILCDPFNYEKSREAILSYEKKFDGVVTFSEYDVPFAAMIQNELGLPRICAGDPLIFRNKNMMRKRLKEGNFNVPRFISTNNLEEALKFLKEVNGPIVIKPVLGADSLYVKKITNEDELTEVWKRYYRKLIPQMPRHISRMTELQLEEYIVGTELSIETVTFNKQTTLMAFTDKHPVEEPYFIETGHKYPCTLPKEDQAEMFKELKEILSFFSVENTVCHTEAKWDGKKMTVVEIAARLAGGSVPPLIKMASGYDVTSAAIDVALGIKPNININWNMGVTARAITWDRFGIIKNITGVEEARLMNGVKQIDLYRNIGERTTQPPDDTFPMGRIIAIGKDAYEADSIAMQAASKIKYSVDQL